MNIFSRSNAGLSLVEAMIAAALISLVFGALLGGTRVSLELITNSRAKLSAVSLASDRMEQFRSLPYDDVGTVSGIPPGVIPQNSTTTLNGIEFAERVLVEYVDDPADGAITATTTDSNGIPSDYKRIKIEITWEVYDTPGVVTYVSNIVPRSIETTEGGGTVRVNVIDQDSQPLPNVSVQLRNDTTTSTIDVTRLSDTNGTALFSGAPAASGYEVFVSAPGFSSDQTYQATTSNPNPITAPFTVLESDISTLTFQIDELSDVDVSVLNNVSFGSVGEDFSSSSGIATSTDTAVSGGELRLAGGSGSYSSSGTAFLNPITPTLLDRWESITAAFQTPGSTAARLQFYTASGTAYSLIPDSEISGNSTGFTDSIVDISNLDAIAYPSIVVGVSLSSSNPSFTAAVDEISVYYRESESVASGLNLDVRGNKIIGTDLSSAPIYKYSDTFTTNGVGEVDLADMEFDSYEISVPAGYDIAYSCPTIPLSHRGGDDSVIEIGLTANTAHSLQVRVVDDLGNTVPGAQVLLESTGESFSGSKETNPCGSAFFAGLATASDYEITVTKTGYSDANSSAVTVDDDSQALLILVSS